MWSNLFNKVALVKELRWDAVLFNVHVVPCTTFQKFSYTPQIAEVLKIKCKILKTLSSLFNSLNYEISFILGTDYLACRCTTKTLLVLLLK